MSVCAFGAAGRAAVGRSRLDFHQRDGDDKNGDEVGECCRRHRDSRSGLEAARTRLSVEAEAVPQDQPTWGYQLNRIEPSAGHDARRPHRMKAPGERATKLVAASSPAAERRSENDDDDDGD